MERTGCICGVGDGNVMGPARTWPRRSSASARDCVCRKACGIVTALGADSPEILLGLYRSALNHHELGLGVVLGSNIFNLAGLLGLSALVAGRVSIGRQGLWFNGGTSLVVSAVVTALVLQWIAVGTSLVLLALVLLPYFVLTGMHPPQLARLALPASSRRFLAAAIGPCAATPASARTSRMLRARTWPGLPLRWR